MTQPNRTEMLVYIGTYTKREPSADPQRQWVYQGRGEGIYLYRLDLSTGALTFVSVVKGIINPSFLAIDPGHRYLYAVNQVVWFAGAAEPGGAVNAFAIDPQTGELAFLNQQPSHGTGPCYLSVDATGRYVLVANYRSGSAAVLPIQNDGRLGAATGTVQHQGSSLHPQRQAGPHAHSITLDPANRYAFVADLGLDKVMIYQLDLTQGKLRPNDQQPWVQLQAGAGPRHFAFHPSRKYAYLINELDSTMTAFGYDETNGTLRELQTLSTLPEDFVGRSHCADVHMAPSGKFVYGSNRGHNSIAIFAVDESTGRLTVVGHEPTGGRTPRNFGLDPTGHYLLAANQDTDTVVVFAIDQQTGKLAPTGQVIDVPTPVCVKMIPRGLR